MPTSRMPGRAYAQASVSSSTAPSFSPGTSTICACTWMPAASSRSSAADARAAACLPDHAGGGRGRRPRAATRAGARCAAPRCAASSSGARFVRVTNVPDRKLSRKSSSRSVSEGRMPSGSWRMKQNGHAFRHCLHAVEHHAFEREAPVLPFVAHKLHLARVAVQIDVADARRRRRTASQRQSMTSRTGRPSTLRHAAARLEPCVVGGAAGFHVHDERAQRGGLPGPTPTCCQRRLRCL